MAPMRLTAWEEERLLIFSAAELARRHRDAGLPLNHPETVALICDAVLEAARDGAGYADAEAAGRGAVSRDELMPGVAALIDEVRIEALFGDGPRLIVLVDPLGTSGSETGERPGAIRSERTPADSTAGLDAQTLLVRNDSARVVRVSSHYPFERVNARLVFDRPAAAGFRLDLAAGDTERWAPGETREVRLVRYAGGRKPAP
jgi:urease subunit gamma/beta